MVDKGGDTLNREDFDLITGMDQDPDMPEFLRGSSDELTADEMQLLEADKRGETLEEPGDGTTQTETETSTEAETGLLNEQGAEGDQENADGQGDDDDVDADGKPKMVDHRALHKEREGHKTTKKELAEWRDKFSRLEGRIDALQDLGKAGQSKGDGDEATESADEDPMPDAEEDIFGYAKWQGRRIERLEAANKQTADTVAEGQRQTATATEKTEIVRAFQQDAQTFSGETPEFAQAYTFLVASRTNELKRLGYTDPKEQVAKINEDEMSIVRTAIANGESPSEILYELARERGFQPGSTSEQQNSETKTDAAAQSETSSQNAKGADTATTKAQSGAKTIEDLKKAQNAAMSLSSAGGADALEITAESLIAMSDEQFDAFYAKHKAEVDRVMGK